MKNSLTAILIFLCGQSFSQVTDSTDFFYQKGKEEKAAKRYLTASKNFDIAIKLNPKFTAAYLENGYANLEMRKTDAAIINFTKANELEPENNMAINELMNLYFNYRQYNNAVAFAQKCTNCANAERVMALSYFQQEDYGKAEKALLIPVGGFFSDTGGNWVYVVDASGKKAVKRTQTVSIPIFRSVVDGPALTAATATADAGSSTAGGGGTASTGGGNSTETTEGLSAVS